MVRPLIKHRGYVNLFNLIDEGGARAFFNCDLFLGRGASRKSLMQLLYCVMLFSLEVSDENHKANISLQNNKM